MLGPIPVPGTGGGVALSDSPTWTAPHIWETADAGTTTVPIPNTFQHRNNAAGTPAAGYGTGLLFRLDSSARTLRSAVELDAVWSTATDASEVSALVLKTMQAGALVETARFGGIAPAVDLQVGLGRVLLDSRTTDVAHFSHRSMTTTGQYALKQTAAGVTSLNAAAGQDLLIAQNNTTFWKIDGATAHLLPGGDNTRNLGAVATRLKSGYFAEYLEMSEQTAPAAPGADKARLFLQDNGAGKTQLMVIFATGAAIQIAIQA